MYPFLPMDIEMLGPWSAPIALLQGAFTIWMLVDSYQRGAEYFWFWVILFFQPFGAWIYFFVVKFRTFSTRAPFSTGRSTGTLFDRKISLEELRHRVDRSPTVANRLHLADRLMDKKQFAEAAPHLEGILAVEPSYCQALFALAECRLGLDQPEAAVELLKKLLDKEPRWSNYKAWRTLVEAYETCNKPELALEACRKLEQYTPTLEIKCLLAEHLMSNQKSAEAITLLDNALEDHRFSSFGKKLREWRWSRRASALIQEAEKAERK